MNAPAKIRGILFDKDGTLLDFNRTWLPPYRRAARVLQRWYAAEPEELLARGGFLAESGGWRADSPLASGCNREIIALWSECIGREIGGDALREVEECFALPPRGYVPVVEDIGAILHALRARGIALGLATMDDEANAHSSLRSLGVTAHFDFVCGADSGHGVKPHAGMALAFCAACNLQCEQVAVVGDSPKDLQMGASAGAALSIGVLSGAHDAEALAGADMILQNIGGIESALGVQLACEN